MGYAIKWGCKDCGHIIWTACGFPFMVYENGILEPWQGHERANEYGAWTIANIQTVDGVVRIKVINGYGFHGTQAYCPTCKKTRLEELIVQHRRIQAVGYHSKGDLPDVYSA